MKSATLPSFWTAYAKIEKDIKQHVKKAYRLWAQNPFHPSLHFKCINNEEGIWSVRVSLAYRATGVMEGDTVTWFWIGRHADYERYFG
ncbi:MAG: hypothetical protein ABSA77_08455 [Thermoguttaceae bacterium]|jgi:hypothetical protein